MWLKNLFLVLNIAVLVVISYLIIIFFDKNCVKCEICYPSADRSGLLAQPKQVKNSRNQQDFVKNIVNEVLLGPVNGRMRPNRSKIDVNPFPKESKLISLWLDEDTLFLNFNKELLLNVQEFDEKNSNNLDTNLNKKNNCKFSLNYLILYSIINTVNKNCPAIKYFYLCFEGNYYKYIDGFGPMDVKLQPDSKIFVK